MSLWFQGCAGCKCPPAVPTDAPFDVEIHEMELCTVLKAQEESFKKNADEEDEEEEEEKEAKAQDSNQAAAAEEQSLRSETLAGET